MRRRSWALVLPLALASALAFAACGDQAALPPVAGFDAATGPDTTEPEDSADPFGGDASVDASALTISPADKVVSVTYGQPAAPINYVAYLGSAVVSPSWSIDRGELGSIDVSTGVFTPKGTLGGKATITANLGGKIATTSVTVQLAWTQNGDPSAGDAGGGAGGSGGVGGEGPGSPVSQATLGVLGGVPLGDPGLTFLYPYDATVWPRGVLAPLLQWQPGAQGDYDAVSIHLSESAFDYRGTFNKTATPFLHHPVPQAVWKALAYSNAGEDVKVEVVFAKGTQSFGPLTQTWKIAGGTLKGTVYYNSYGTNLARNYCCTQNNATFGGATLAVKGGSTDPVLVSGSDTACRVCHSVAADGSRLVTQNGANYNLSMHVDLKAKNLESPLSPADGRFTFPGIFPDGSMLLSNGGPVISSNPPASALYALPSGAAIASSGLPSDLRASLPAFSPDGKHVSFGAFSGTGADGKSLSVYDFDPKTKVFSNGRLVDTPSSGMDVWSSFLPTSDAVVFEREVTPNGRDYAGTRSTCDASGPCSNTGTQGELWWADLKTKTARRLDRANGKGVVPVGPNGHGDDSLFNYEPTVNPVVSGGYAWVVFTSRRMYGNVATVNPYWSDPRFHDISKTPTTKKLWVAAIDLNAPPGTDPSHPAFYLPAQELLAGNSRGFWVVDPCKQDGNGCESGDECCGGYCRSPGDGGALVCTTQVPTCAQEFEKCTSDGDCCQGGVKLACINGRCGAAAPN